MRGESFSLPLKTWPTFMEAGLHLFDNPYPVYFLCLSKKNDIFLLMEIEVLYASRTCMLQDVNKWLGNSFPQ